MERLEDGRKFARILPCHVRKKFELHFGDHGEAAVAALDFLSEPHGLFPSSFGKSANPVYTKAALGPFLDGKNMHMYACIWKIIKPTGVVEIEMREDDMPHIVGF